MHGGVLFAQACTLSAAEVVWRRFIILNTDVGSPGGAVAGINYLFAHPGEYVLMKNQRTAELAAVGELTIRLHLRGGENHLPADGSKSATGRVISSPFVNCNYANQTSATEPRAAAEFIIALHCEERRCFLTRLEEKWNIRAALPSTYSLANIVALSCRPSCFPRTDAGTLA